MDIRHSGLASAILLAGLLATLGACHKQESPPAPQVVSGEGPAERAGKELDRAATSAGEKMAEAKDKAAASANQAERKTGQALEKAGEKMQQDANK